MAEQDPVLGPIDYLVLRVAEAKFGGSIAGAILDLVASGTVRILDIAVVHKAADGTVEGVPLEDLPVEQAGVLAGLVPFTAGLLGPEDFAAVGETLEAGEWGGVLVWENTWAEPFVAAVIAEGGEVLASGRIPATELNNALAG